jgi:hypothetical protein
VCLIVVSWTKSLPVKSVVRDSSSDIMAVFTKNGGCKLKCDACTMLSLLLQTSDNVQCICV